MLLKNHYCKYVYKYRIRETLLKNIQNKEYETPIVYSTNKPWKIDNK